MKFATGRRPDTAGKMPGELSVADGEARFVYAKSHGAVEDGTRFTVEWSETTLPGSWNSLGIVEEVEIIESTVVWMRATLPPRPSGRCFFRLRVVWTRP